MSAYDEFKNLLTRKRFREAVVFAEKQAFGNNIDAVFWLNQQAIALLRLGRFEEAVAAADKALVRNPRSFYSMLIRAEALLKTGKAEEALEGFREAERYPEAHERAKRGIAESLIALRRFEEALSELADQAGDFSETASLKIQALEGLGRTDEAITECQKWLKESPDNRKALWFLCNLEVKRDGINATLSKYEKLAKIPSRPAIYGELCAMLYRKAGRFDRAVGQYDKISYKSDGAYIARQKAFALAKSGREKEALPVFEELLRERPDDRYVNSAYIAASRRAGYLEEAWKFYHELISRFPEDKTLFGRIRKIGKELEAASLQKEESDEGHES